MARGKMCFHLSSLYFLSTTTISLNSSMDSTSENMRVSRLPIISYLMVE